LLEHSNVVSFIYDLAAGCVVYISRTYEQVIGDPIGHIHEDLSLLLARVHRDDWQHLYQQLAQAEMEEVVPDVELRLVRTDDGL
jgi:hypothetical protein